MNEASDGVRDKSTDRKDEDQTSMVGKELEKTDTKIIESGSRNQKMVENSASKETKHASSSDFKNDKTRSDKWSSDRRYDSRERSSYKGVNGVKPSSGGRGRRDDDRRQNANKNFRKQDVKGPGSAGSYRRDSARDGDTKKSYDSGKTYLDEPRLTKLVRKILRENDRDRRLYNAKQLVEHLHTPEGAKQATRNSDDVLANLKDVLFERGYKDVKNEVVYCIGYIGMLLGTESQRYFQWLFDQVNSMTDDDVKVYFLQALTETLKCDEKKQMTADFTMLILNHLQTLLENADTPDLLMAVVNVILQVTSVYPHIFQDYFRDTVDILVGWHIDSSQRDKVIAFTSSALISFRQFWVSDQDFTQELMGQFLEDTEAYAEDLGLVMAGGQISTTTVPEEVVKMRSLLNVFSTVIKSLGEDFDPHTSVKLHMHYLLEVLSKTVHAIDNAMKHYFSETVAVTANEYLGNMLHLVGREVLTSEGVTVQPNLLGYLTTVLLPAGPVTNKYMTTSLGLLGKVIEIFGTQLPVDKLTSILGPRSILQTGKLSNSAQVLKCINNVYKILLGLKSIPLLEETYRHILGDIQQGFNRLLESCGDEKLLQLVPKNPFDGVKYSTREAEVVCVFNLCILGEIGNTKNNLIGMWALSPSLFDLYCDHLDVVRPSISVQYPALQYAILQSLYSHANTHGNFISTCSLLSQSASQEGSLMANVSPSTSANFTRLMKLLMQLLSHANTSYDCKLLGVKWMTELVTSLHSSPQVYTTRQFLSLVQALYHVGYDQEEDVASAVHLCLSSLFQSPKHYPRYIIKGCVKLCMYRLNEGSEILRDNYISLLCLLPLNVMASKNNGLYLLEEDRQLVYSEACVGLPALWQVCRTFSTKIPLGSFHSHNFRQVMGYLLQNNGTKVAGSQAWLDTMYQSAQRPNSKPDWKTADGLIMQNYISRSPTVQWFWTTWEAAQFCILTRLKTPLGKPQDTFTSIEAVLKSFAGQVNKGQEENDSKSKGAASDCDAQLRVKLLLQFMDHLEKHLYNAYEGAAVSMPGLPKAVRTFFRTNKNTCQEWLSRIRMYMIVMALHAGMYSTVIRQASEVLHDLKDAENTQTSDIELVLLYMVQALCALGEPDSIQGLYAWCKERWGKKMSWLKAAVEKAYGRYEVAVKEYKTAVKSALLADPDSREDGGSSHTSRVTAALLGRSGAEGGSPQNMVLSAKLNVFANEVADCYIQLNDWEAVLEWHDAYTKLRADSNLNLAEPVYTMDPCLVRALSAFDSEEMSAVGDHLDLIPAMSGLSQWGLAGREQEASCKLLRASTIAQQHTINNHKSEIMGYLSDALDVCEGIIRVQSMEWPVLASHNSLALLTTAATLQDHIENKTVCLLPLSDNLQVDESDHCISTMLQAVRLVKLQQSISGGVPELSDQLLKLQLCSASLARKQQNYGLAMKLLAKQANLLLESCTEVPGVTEGHMGGTGGVGVTHVVAGAVTGSLDSLKVALKRLQCYDGVSRLNTLRIERETAKLIHCIGEQREGVEMLTQSVVYYTTSDKAKSALCSELCARSLLTLVNWLQVDHKLLSSVASKVGQGDGSSSQLTQNVQVLLDLEERTSASSQLVIAGDISDLKIDTDRIVGRLLHLSTIQCESLPKSWYALAGWCYKWGRKAVDNASHGSVQLYTDEKAQILQLLPEGINSDEKESVMTILGHIHSGMTSEEDISDQDQYDEDSETTRRQLLSSCVSLQSASEACIDGLLNVWRGVVLRIYHYYQLSASAYFKFLKLNGGADPLKEDNTEDCNVISTLRVLRLLVKHAWELRTVLETGLAATPTAPWKGIIPQLFSRLSHPEAYVRQSISDLLCRVAEDAPHLIVYPAVVGSSTSKLDTKPEPGLLNKYLTSEMDGDGCLETTEDINSQEDDELPSELEDESMLHNCILSMLNTLAANFPQMISDVKQLIEELRRITLLWDELWLGTLNQQHQDVERCMTQLEAEIKKVNNNNALSKDEKTAIIREKHKTVLKRTVYNMERLYEITCQQSAQTPQERWFQDTYGQQIANALERLKHPPNPSHPRASWHPFKQIHLSLQHRAQKRNSLVLSMDEISPKLHSLRNTVIAMPGLGTAGQVVTIESVSNTVQILPTKTKPKKLVFKGSDGKRYPYLFKGLEDLHLDERIMQFLNIVNNMFASGDKGCHELYRARHYSVTPLGPRSGLIQWVDGVTPLFALYKRWQQREALVQLLKQQAAGSSATGSNQQPSIPRPSEIYYNKLTPLLREKGVKDLESRKDWPLNVQRKVLEELMTETPRDLLARELLCTSTGSNEWWYVTQTYARSTAVMSMIGYIIGLGDRHLDNVLVDLSTGEVVHIDYNVCFEKGKGLRVPERVPFRLTQNIEAALGITGIEGTFRLASEHVMKTLRKGRETLLTLLEAFVYDPLVDWTTGNEGGYTGAFYGGGLATGTNALETRQGKLDMEKEITSSMFSIRVAEMKVTWLQNRDELVAVLPRIQGHLDSRSDRIAEYTGLMSTEERLQELKLVIVEAQSNPASPLYSLHDRYKEYVVIKTSQDVVNKLVEEKINDYLNWQQMHKHVVAKMQGSVFQKMCADIAQSLNLGTPSFATANEFLQGAGQGSIIQQCEQVEMELTSDLQIQRSNLSRVIDILHTYCTIVSQFGASYAENTRTGNYLLWLQELVSNFTEAKCVDIEQQFNELYGDLMYSQNKVSLLLPIEGRLHTIIQETNTRLFKLIERRSIEKSQINVLEQQVQKSRAEIESFVQEYGEFGASSLSAVTVTVLCALNKRNLQMEAAATGAGDRLMSLTSRDGDWFLEELCSMSGNVAQFLDMIKACQQYGDNLQFSVMYKGMTATNHVYTALQDLNVNFRSIILPEALKIIQSQESSVFTVLAKLETIVPDAGPPLDTVISQLEVQHRNAVMGIKNENMELLTTVHGIQKKFTALLESGGSGDLSPGQMLLMGFNGLFTRLDDEFNTVMECMDAMNVPDVWKKVDVIREAKSLQLSSFTANTRSLLSSLFFVRRLQVMQEFFHMCTQFAAAIQGFDGGNCFDDEQFTRPVKCFIADFVRKQIIGFPSQILGYTLCLTIQLMGLDVTAEIEQKDIGAESKAPLDEMCKKAVDLCMRSGHFEQVHFSQASTLTSAQDATWRRHDLTRRLDSNIELLHGSLNRAQQHITRLQWLHEDIFLQAGIQPVVAADRAYVMSEIKKRMQSVVSQKQRLSACQVQYSQLESSIIQRLKWAAGANPSLHLILQQFEDASSVRKQLAEEEAKNSQDVINLCQGILHLEALRTRTPEALSLDKAFLSLINQCKDSCVLTTNSTCSVTPAEVMLMELAPLDEGQTTDGAWLKVALLEVTNQLKEGDKTMLALKNSIDDARDGIRTEVNNIKGLLSTHHKLMSEIRAILKSLAKQEEQDEGEVIKAGGVRDYTNLYKQFSENLTMALKMIVSEEFTAESMQETKNSLSSLTTQIPQIYEDLINLAPPLPGTDDEARNTSPLSFATALKKSSADGGQGKSGPTGAVLQQVPVGSTPPNTASPQTSAGKPSVSTPVRKSEKITRDPKTGKAIQERNSYAVGVWRRVKMKLDGRDPDQNKRLSVPEQVEYVIKDAMNRDNLAVLYEGWTPWV